MIALSPEASAQLDALERYYVRQRRPQALRKLGAALEQAAMTILTAPAQGRDAPRPYPELARLGLSWLKQDRYWIAYDPTRAVIAGIYFDTDDIPGRIP